MSYKAASIGMYAALRHKMTVKSSGVMIEGSERDVSKFLNAYITCALWSSTDISPNGDIGLPLDKNYTQADISPECLEQMTADCHDFMVANDILLSETDLEQSGHDFWLSRNRHGAGFFDRGLGKTGDILQEAAKKYGEVNLYIGDDNKIHSS